jgi:membrane associated rhomboid family serine protease
LRANTFVILLCIAASFWAWQQNPTLAQQNLVFSYNNLLHRRIWTLVTALFVHANLLHLVGNMLFLFIFGSTLEKSAGARAYLAAFFSGGFSSFLLSPLFMPRGAGMLGASAAIFTVAACVMLVQPLKFSWVFLAPQGLVALIYFIYNLVVVSRPSFVHGYDPHVAYIAHIIGFLVGVPFGVALSRHWKKNLLLTLLLLVVYLAILHAARNLLLGR